MVRRPRGRLGPVPQGARVGNKRAFSRARVGKFAGCLARGVLVGRLGVAGDVGLWMALFLRQRWFRTDLMPAEDYRDVSNGGGGHVSRWLSVRGRGWGVPKSAGRGALLFVFVTTSSSPSLTSPPIPQKSPLPAGPPIPLLFPLFPPTNTAAVPTR